MIDSIKLGKRIFDLGTKDNRAIPYIMGILNVTPDSFSDGGRFINDEGEVELDIVLRAVEQMINDGADIIDVGGESTRPGFDEVTISEEIARTSYVIEAIKERFNITVSLDTRKSKVAEVGALAGADIINDVSGLAFDEDLVHVMAKTKLPVILMHERAINGSMDKELAHMKAIVDMAVNAGVDRDKIIVDPGIGFGKTLEDNRLIINNLERFSELDLPVLLGTSRKSVIGNTLELPVTEREEGTIATSVIGLMKGVQFFRVHDVKKNYRALKMAAAIINEK